ncbi:MAG: L-histidine N(alpha)-methyltransferase [Sulfuricella sp.]|nr:L-histidine N(alpha)-methyltransferase [Sulfuricella sp.]
MTQTIAAFRYYDCHPAPADLHAEVIRGLSREPRGIPPKFFYDEAGSRLFDAICATPEYYPARVETGIIRRNLLEIVACVGSGSLLIEPGSGDCRKVRELLAAIRPRAYVPVDISGAWLRQAARRLAEEFPWLDIHAVCADFTAPLDLPCRADGARRVAFFPGSSIGNFDPGQAVGFLSHLAAMVRQGGGLLIGVDLKKDAAVLNAAYNDVQGLTAAFNRNLLVRINRDLAANFEVRRFSHRAFYNEAEGRIEMHLVSETRQRVLIGGRCFDFEPGEGIHTENSYKYTVAQFQELAEQAGFEPVRVWTDADGLFSVHYLEARGNV